MARCPKRPLLQQIKSLNAANFVGNTLLAGNAQPNIVIFDKDNSSVWGGAENVSDTLYGGSEPTEFYYGIYDGNDIIVNYDASKDIINLYSGNTITVFSNASDIFLGVDGHTVTIKNNSGKIFKFKLLTVLIIMPRSQKATTIILFIIAMLITIIPGAIKLNL